MNMLAQGTGKQAKITVKWDGKPAIVCGIDPADGRFFVGTKGVFGKNNPSLIKSVKDADKFFGEIPELRDLLIVTLKQLKKLNIGGVIQGDLMFHPGKPPEAETINGEKVITFRPNTITYSVPAKSELAQKILRAKIGIVFHTVYDGASMQEMTASFGFDAGSLTKHKDVWADDATYKDLTGSASFTPTELKKVQSKIRQAEATLAKIKPAKFNVILDNKDFKASIKPFVNQLVRKEIQPGSVNVQQFLKDFHDFYISKVHAEIEKKQMDPESRAYKTRQLKLRQQEEFLDDNMNALAGVLAVFKRLAEIKLLIIAKLHQVEGMGTFVKDGDGYKVTSPEGFVAIGHDGGAVKLVDRLEFSKNNFANPDNNN